MMGWEDRLDLVVRDYRARPFQWGSADCLLFAASCAEAVTGVDPAASLRGTYDDALGAARVLRDLGFADVGEALAGNFWEYSAPHAFAMRGDLALVQDPSADDALGAVGVILGPLVAAYGANGLHMLPRAAIKRSFRVS